MSRRSAAPVYEDMARSAEEIKGLNTRVQELQTLVFEKDNELIVLKSEGNEVHDIGTFKFVAESVGLPLDTVVKIFILIIVLVFDPLAVCLVLAYNIARGGSILKETKDTKQLLVDQPVPQTRTRIIEETIEEVIPGSEKTRKYTSKA
jgi:hypothetical protein